jgi:hypothetical protein
MIIKCRKKTETDSSRAVMQGDYTHLHNQVANTVHREYEDIRRLIKGKLTSYCKYNSPSVLENS